MSEPDKHDDGSELKAPERLVEALGGLRKAAIFIPPNVDEAVLRRAKLRLAMIRGRRVQLRRTALLALAASVVFAFLVGQFFLGRPGTFAKEDLNHDGRVDILDAFQLARDLRDGKAGGSTGDVNADGKIDEGDVILIARRAVKLEDSGRL